ncbi:MAG: 2,3,4,5-tetrahydropyridine-2,6-dicarboxylate N-succinyltransferase [Candidatus Melainabacteria bacterium]|jgi:2,3,4,5-tetrahydropyridine-2-carboxylate N-succinyltransferase|nr:2,3,4,5-tetrahydropyridine-2,6-dicarboxylate N-succinyltransferase [Candidatus Melainabacteria bacterium]
MQTTNLEQQIEELFEAKTLPADAIKVVEEVIEALDSGKIRTAEKIGNEWKANSWVKKAILLYFRLRPVEKMEEGPFCDKVPLKVLPPPHNRIVPYSSVRKGSYIAPKVVIMAPSFVNIGAYVDEGSMIDSLVLVGSCAQVGKNVHIGAGTVIGGVLEPPNSTPVIIEDGAFVGGSCGIYEGCIVEKNAVIGAGTIITARTPIIDISSGEEHFGRVPENAVVVPGGRQKKVGDHELILQTPLIIKRRDPQVSAKLAMEDSLRVFE